MFFWLKVGFFKFVIAILGVVLKLVSAPKPTIFAGKGATDQLCAFIDQCGAKKVLINTDTVLVKLGLVGSVASKLQARGIDVVIFDGVLPDPTFEVVNQSLAIARDNQCDAVLAVGGGSCIDSAKVVALCGAHPGKQPADFVGYFKGKNSALPFFAIPTTAGTGSEVTIAAVISDAETHDKKLVIETKLVPIAAALDPELMTGMPAPITAATGIDALTHAVESYVATLSTRDSRMYARMATKLIFDNLEEAYNNGVNLDARNAMALASFYAGLAFTRTSVGYVHAVAHSLGGKYGTPHGLANAIALPYILDFYGNKIDNLLAELAIASMGVDANQDEAVLANLFRDRIRALLTNVNVPSQLDALRKEDIPAIRNAALFEAHLNYPVPRYMNSKTCDAILLKMLPQGG